MRKAFSSLKSLAAKSGKESVRSVVGGEHWFRHLLFAETASGSEIPLPLTPWADVKTLRNVENSMGAGESWLAPP